jgi:hypothetical protein
MTFRTSPRRIGFGRDGDGGHDRVAGVIRMQIDAGESFGCEVLRDVVGIAEQATQVEPGRVVDVLPGRLAQEWLRVDGAVLSGGVQLEDLGLRGLGHAVEAAVHGEGEDDLAVVGLPVVAPEEIGDRLSSIA